MRLSDLKRIFTRFTGGYAVLASGQRFYQFTSAITAGVTTTTAPAGSLAITGHATGKKQFFVSDGTYWQDYNGRESLVIYPATIATGGATNGYTTVPFTGKLIAAIFSGVDALVQHGTNYQTFSLTNLGQDGSGAAAMLAATDANTTKTSTGAAVAANTPRNLTLTGTAADLAVTQGDRLKFTTTPSGTPANTITFPVVLLVFQRTV